MCHTGVNVRRLIIVKMRVIHLLFQDMTDKIIYSLVEKRLTVGSLPVGM